MSLSKQLFFLMSFLFLIIFVVNYVTGVSNIKEYLQTEAKIHAEDTATSLGISLQPYIHDKSDTMLPTLINAVFDRGYYGRITLSNLEDRILVNRENPITFGIVPSWFSNTLPLETVTAVREINSGWNLVAKVMVEVHPGYAYLKLWNQAKRAFLYSVVTYVVSLVVLGAVLRMVMKPLHKIKSQAEAIGNGQFRTIDPLPWTKEIQSVAIAMNVMSDKIRQIITSLQTKLGDTERKLSTDSVTGLETRTSFDATLKQLFVSNTGGYIFLLRIDNLGEIARNRSNDDVDRFLHEFSNCIKESSSDHPGVYIYRLGGSEFAIIAKSIDRQHAEQLCRGLSDAFNAYGKKKEVPDIAHIGGISFDPLGTTQSIMSAALESYNKARLIGSNSFVIEEKSSGSFTKDEWAKRVKSVLDKDLIEIMISDQAEDLQDSTKDQILLEETNAKVHSEDGQALSIGTFISVADQLGFVTKFDQMILQKVLDHIRSSGVTHDVGVNLSFSSIANPDFRSQLYSLIEANKDISGRLVFCLTAYAAAKDLTLLLSFKDLVRRTGTKLMVKRYEPRFLELEVLKECNFDYIRLARNYTEDISGDGEKEALITTMVETGNLLDSIILAESVSVKDWPKIISLGVHGASRKNEAPKGIV
jgi:EAL domain-containing protein (putative c-di-GMP-specific phosphodiesterase class I)/GGDEF domain-containing protein